MSIEIKSLRTDLYDPECPWQVRIDRGNSILSSPYKLEKDTAKDRQFVIAHYTRYFNQKCEQNGEFLKELYRLHELHQNYGKLELFCWCAPKPCHGDVIKKFLENASEENLYERLQ